MSVVSNILHCVCQCCAIVDTCCSVYNASDLGTFCNSYWHITQNKRTPEKNPKKPVTVEVIVWFCDHLLLHSDVENYWSITKLISEVLHCVCDNSCFTHQELHRHRLKTTTWKNTVSFSALCIRTIFLVVQDQGVFDQTIKRRIVVCTTHRRLVVAGYRSRHPDRRPWLTPELKPSALVSFVIIAGTLGCVFIGNETLSCI